MRSTTIFRSNTLVGHAPGGESASAPAPSAAFEHRMRLRAEGKRRLSGLSAVRSCVILLGLIVTAALPVWPQTPAALPDEALRKVTVAAGYVAAPEALEDDGVIVASATEGEIEERSLSVFDVIHVTPSFDGRAVAVGDTVLLYRDDGELRHPESGESLGRIVHPTGLAAVTATEGDVASAVIVEAFAPVVAGQGVQYLRSGDSPLPAGELVRGEGVVVGLRDPAAIVEPYAVVYLDLPAGADLQAGEDVELFRLVSEENRELPEVLLGTARVLDVGPAAATAIVVTLDRSDLEVGDRYRAVVSEG